MENSVSLKITFTFFLVLVASCSSKIIVIENSYQLLSSDFEYPNNTDTLDVLWLFDHSIRLQLNEFHLNGHMGDFVLVSEYPLLNANDFILKNHSDDGYVNDLAESIITEQGLLLSWMVDSEIIEAVNPKGTFVYFHSEKKDPSWTATFKGFDIEVLDYDEFMTTTTSTTADPLISPRPGQNIYISKFLDCKPPMEFFSNTADFKSKIAELATEFCNENDISLDSDIRPDEVNIPGPEEGPNAGLHYCETGWPNYATCVEVTFAIVRVDSVGNYILTAERLEEMWAKKANDLRKYGYCSFDPPKPVLDLNTLVFIAFFCGIIISLLILLTVAWIKNTKILLDYKMQAATAGNKDKDFDEKPQFKHFDEGNPLNRFIPSSLKPNYHVPREELYPTQDYLDQNDVEQSTNTTRNRSKAKNSNFETIPAEVHAHDNIGFEREHDDYISNSVHTNPLLLSNATLEIASASGGRGSASEI